MRIFFICSVFPFDAAPPIVRAGTVLARCRARLPHSMLFAKHELIAPAATIRLRAIAGIPASLDLNAYICSGTWSLVGTLSRVR